MSTFCDFGRKSLYARVQGGDILHAYCALRVAYGLKIVVTLCVCLRIGCVYEKSRENFA